MTVSGTINRTKVGVTSILDQSFGKARIKPQQITAEMLDLARNDLDTYLKTITETGVKLWTYEPIVVKMKDGHQNVDLPEGTSDVDHVTLRDFVFAAPSSITMGSVSLLPLLGDVGSTSPFYNPIDFVLASTTQGEYELHISFLQNLSRKLTIRYTIDGTTLTTPEFLAPAVDQYRRVYPSKELAVFNVTLPIGTTAFHIEDADGLAMQVFDLMLVRGGKDTMLYPWGEDQIARTGDSFRGGRPNNYFVRRLVDKTQIMLWPVPTSDVIEKCDLLIWRKRHIMDVGRLTNTLDIPSRWLEAIVWQLGWRIAQREPEAAASWSEVKAVADEIEAKARETERVQGPIKINFRRR